jgi:hypothetical protein
MIFNQTRLLTGAALIRRHCVQRLGDFDSEIRLGEDVDFFGPAMREFGACFIPREIQQHLDGTRRMAGKYRSELGRWEFYVMKGLSRQVLTPCTTILR